VKQGRRKCLRAYQKDGKPHGADVRLPSIIVIQADLPLSRWISTLLFTKVAWDALPSTNLDKLVLDIGKPIRLEPTDFNRKTYIS
jgi:hypothetical protein